MWNICYGVLYRDCKLNLFIDISLWFSVTILTASSFFCWLLVKKAKQWAKYQHIYMVFLTIYCQNIGLSIGSPNISVYYFGTSKYFEQLSVWLHPFNLFINHLVPHLDRLQAIMFTNVCQFSLSSQEYFPLICCLSEFPPPSFEMFKMGNNFQ